MHVDAMTTPAPLGQIGDLARRTQSAGFSGLLFTETGRTRAPAWRNEVTLRTLEMLMEYEPGTYIDRISPTPLLMIIAAGDHLAVADEAFAAYNRALEPKKLVVLPGGHFDAYVGPGFEMASTAARDWFVQHLRPAPVATTVR